MAKKPARASADISADLFRIAAAFVAKRKDDRRESMRGVHICRHPGKGVDIVATNGKRIIILHDARGYCRSPLTLAARAGARMVPKRKPGIDNRWSIGGRTATGRKRVPTIDGEYPDWRRLLKAIKPGKAMPDIDPRFVRDFARAAETLAWWPNAFPRMKFVPGAGPNDPVCVLFPHAPHAFGIVMPMRNDGTATLPKFIRALQPRKRAKSTAKTKGRI